MYIVHWYVQLPVVCTMYMGGIQSIQVYMYNQLIIIIIFTINGHMLCHTVFITSPQDLTDIKLNRTLIHIFTCIHAKAICLCYI